VSSNLTPSAIAFSRPFKRRHLITDANADGWRGREGRSSGSVGPKFRQSRFAGSRSFGHRFKKLGLPHRLALARRVYLPSPGSGRTPFVLNGEGEIRGVESGSLFHPRAIEIPIGQRPIRRRHGATSTHTLVRAAVLPRSPSTAEFHASPG
jgi:hypothetical protein